MSGGMGRGEFAAWVQLLGVSREEVADLLGVNVRSVVRWLGGAAAVTPGRADDVRRLVGEHDRHVAEALTAGRVVLPVESAGGRPRSWWVGVAARALATHMGVSVEDGGG